MIPLYTDAELASHGFTAWHPDHLSDWAPEAIVLMTGHSAFADLDLVASARRWPAGWYWTGDGSGGQMR